MRLRAAGGWARSHERGIGGGVGRALTCRWESRAGSLPPLSFLCSTFLSGHYVPNSPEVSNTGSISQMRRMRLREVQHTNRLSQALSLMSGRGRTLARSDWDALNRDTMPCHHGS